MNEQYYINLNSQSYKYIDNWLYFVQFNKKKKKNEQYKQNLLITGPCGIGKSTYLNILLEKYKFTVFEFNLIDFKEVQNIKDQINNIINFKNIESLFNNKKDKKIIVINQIDQLSVTDKNALQIVLHYIESFNKKNKKTTQIKQPIPIVFMANKYKPLFKNIIKYSMYFKYPLPSNYEIINFSKYYIKKKNIDISEINLIRIINIFPYNFKTIINILDLIYIYISIHKRFNLIPIQNIILNNKNDLDIDIYQSTYTLLNEKQTFNNCGTIVSKDTKYISLLLYKNITNYIHHNTKYDYKSKLKHILHFNTYMNFSSNILHNYLHNNGTFLFNYINYTLGSYTNTLLFNKHYSLEHKPYTQIEKSPIISKLNYKYCNLKYIRIICDTFNINEYSFQTFSHYIYYLFTKHETKKYKKILLNLIKKYNINKKILDKIFKLSYINKVVKEPILYDEIFKSLYQK